MNMPHLPPQVPAEAPNMQPVNKGYMSPEVPDEQFNPDLMEGMGEDPFGRFRFEDARNQGSFVPGAEYQTADLAGIRLDPGKMTTGQNNRVMDMAAAYRSFMKQVDNFEGLIDQHGGRIMPGRARDELDTAHAALMMQLKDIYQMGAPQAGDIAMLERLIYNPTDIGANILDTLGGPEVEGRAKASLGQLRSAVSTMVEPYMKAAGIELNELLPAKDPGQMSDEDLLKALGL